MTAVRSYSWNKTTMIARKMRIGRNERTVDDWHKDGCII